MECEDRILQHDSALEALVYDLVVPIPVPDHCAILSERLSSFTDLLSEAYAACASD